MPIDDMSKAAFMALLDKKAPVEKKGPGLFGSVAEGAKALVQGAPIVAKGAYYAARDAVQGFDPRDAEYEADRAAYAREAEAYRKSFEGKGTPAEWISEAAESSGMSGASMIASLGGGAAGMLAGPAGAVAGAGAAGGATAARVDYVDAQRALYDYAKEVNGGELTDEQWQSVLAEYEKDLLTHAAIEGGGEAVGSAWSFGVFKPLGNLAGKAVGEAVGRGLGGKVARGAMNFGKAAAGEVATETGQTMAQSAVEEGVFGTDALSASESFKEVAGPTIAQTAIFGGLMGGAGMLSNRLRARRASGEAAPEGEEPTTPVNSPDNPFGGESYEYQNPFVEGVASRDLSTERIDVVEGELVDGEEARPQPGWESVGFGLPLGREQQRISRVPGAMQSEASREFGRYGWREGDAMVQVVGFAGDEAVLDIERNGVHTQEYRPRNDVFTPRLASTPMPEQSPEIDLMAPAPVRQVQPAPQPAMTPTSGRMPGQVAARGMVQPPRRLGLGFMQQAAPVQPMAATGDNMTPVAVAAPAPVQPAPVQEAPGTLRGMPLDQRIVIGGVKPWGAKDADVRKAEQEVVSKTETTEPRRGPLHYKGKTVSTATPPVLDSRREEQFDSLVRALRESDKESDRLTANQFEWQRDKVGFAYDELMEELYAEVNPERAALEKFVTRAMDVKDEYEGERLMMEYQKAPGWNPNNAEYLSNSIVQSIKSRNQAPEAPVSTESSTNVEVENKSKSKQKSAKAPEKWASKEDLEHLFGEEFGSVESPRVDKIAEHFKTQLATGRAYKTIGEARQEIAARMRVKQKDLAKIVKTIDEAVELGVVKAARAIVRSGKQPLEIYRELVDLYKRQPNLGVRTSTSIAEQAYSTPVPLAYLADVLAGVNESTRVYEPTAGNGALLLTASPENAVVNELNHDRAERLRSQGFTVTEEDASTRQLDADVDAVVANPPFGTVMQEDGSKRRFRFRNLETTEIDQAIVLNAMDELAKDGRAVLIIGGKQGGEKARSAKYNTAAQRAFWNTMFENFNVVDHFTVSGDLYSRQGAKYPIDFVVIDGHTPTKDPVFPAARVPRVYESFEALEEKFDEILQHESERSESDRVSEREVDTQPVRADGRDSGVGREVSDAGRAGEQTGTDAGVDKRPVEQERRAGSGRDAGRDGKRDGAGLRDTGRAGRDGKPAEPSQSSDQRGRVPPEDGRSGRDSGTELSGPDSGTGAVRAGLDVDQQSAMPETPKAKKAAPKPKATSTQTAYRTSSDGFQLGTLVPKNMDAPVQDALRRVKDQHRDVDAYVARELGYDSVDEMHGAFAAEQVDALALALDNMGKGKGFILGDQTGIGKGRVCAGILRWAKKNGRTPVFVTMLPDLYADMMRDLNDIGVQDFRPFITNSEISGSKALIAPDGSALSAPKKKDYEAAVEYIKENKELPEGYDAVFTSYSQLQSVKGVPSKRQEILNALQENAVLVLDEAHNAGGAFSSIGLYIRDYTEKMSGGVLYSSATYAKRPDVMSLYNKTDITMIGSQQELEDTTRAGGLPMQQAISAMLTGSGQYIRREKSYEGATMDTVEAAVDMVTADEIAKSMESIMAFSFVMESATAVQDEIAKAQGRAVTGTKSTGGAGAQSTSFGSLMHNLVAQTTLAIKADSVIKSAAEAVKRGEKPIITLSNTMGSFIADYAQTNGLKAGDVVNLTFADMFKSYLEKTREVRVTDATRKVEKKRLTDEELGYAGVQAYNKAMKTIEGADFSRLPVSPIDYILDGLRKAGVRASEITGRTAALDYSGDSPAYRVRKASVAEKQAASRGFNGGDIDCLIINRSGSTGISLHASEKFVDQKRRTMLIVQPDLNIDVFMQTLGRVFRTGQVVPPKYEFVLSNMPSERRPAAVLGKKMASLNANTTASAKGTQSFDNIPDFLNTYGDQAALELLQEDTALNARLGYPLKKEKDEDGRDDVKTEGLVAKLTGRIPLLSVAEQGDVYDRLLKVYQGLVDMADATGTNVLDVKARPLDARIVSRAPLTPRQKGSSPFAAASDLCVCDVKVVGKPYSSTEVKKHVEEGKAAVEALTDGLAERARAYMKKSMARFKDEDAQNRERDKIDEQYRRIYNPLDRYPVGTRVRMTSTAGSYVGVVTNYLTDAGKKEGSNPVAPSAWRVVVDIADAKRRLVVPLSKLVLGDGNIDGGRMLMNYTYDGVGEDAFWKRFDDAQSESRETRLIVMGNIPAGYAKLGQTGEIITFDMHDGQRVMGVMLPKEARGEEVMEDMPVRFAEDEQIIDFFDRTNGRVQVESTDGVVAIDGMQGGKLYHIRVPGSRAEGGRFFLDKNLISAIGEEFVKRSGDMHAEFRGDARLRSVLTLLGMKGLRFHTKVAKNIAREVTGTSVAFVKEGNGGAMASLRPSFASSSPFAALRLTPEARDGMKRVVAELSGGPVQKAPGKRILETVREWVAQNLPGEVRTSEGVVEIDADLVNDSFSHGGKAKIYPNKLEALKAIPDVLEKGAYLGDYRDFEGHPLMNRYWGGKVRFTDGGERYVFIRARQADNAKKSRFYVHDVFTDDMLERVAPFNGSELALMERLVSGELQDQASPKGWEPPHGAILEARILRTIMEVNGQSRTAVEDVVGKLNDAAAGAAPVNVVQSFDELPEHLKENFKDRAGELEGVYDEGTVWIVADNLASPERAAEVWMHEQVGHGGFEALMPELEKKQLLNRLFLMLGGKGNKNLSAVAAEYDFDLGSRAGQHAAMREYLARLAEKDKLEGDERTRWGRVWKHIADSLKKLFYRVTGQNVKLGEMEVRDLLAAMKRRVREGGPDGPKGGTYASLAKEKADSVTANPTSFTAEFKKAFGNLSAQAKKDIGVFEQTFSQPFALAKKSRLIRALLDTQRRREDARRQAFIGAMDGMADFQNMRKEAPTAYKYTRDIIHALDGNKDVLLANDKFLRDEQGNETGLNDEHYAELRDWLMNNRNEKTHGDTQAWSRAVDAYLKLRRGLDRDQLAILERGRELGQTKGKLDAMRKSMGDMPFYFPHMRFGDWYLKVTDKNTGETVYRVHYEAMGKTKAAATAARLKMQLMKDFPESDYSFENGAVQGMPDEVFADSLSTINLEQVLMQALGRLEKEKGWDKDSLWEVRDAMYDQILSVLRSPGFGQHMMKRKGVAGYETDDIYKSIAAYKSGLYGWLTKMDASLAFGEDLALFAANEDVKEQPRTYAYARNYVQDMLRNTDRIDRAVSRIRTFLFVQYLAGNIKTAIVNATQNFTVGIPVLGAELGMGSSYGELVKGAQKAVADWASGRKVGEGSTTLTQEEASFLDDFHGSGEAQSALFNELMGLQDSTLEGGLRKILEWVSKPMHWAERFNRTSLALAAYRAAKAGKVKNQKTLAAYGEHAGESWGEANARKFAREVVDDSHFIYGKMNRPEFLRHSSAGRAFGAAYTFRTFTHSMLSWYYRMLRGEKGAAGRLAVLHSIWNTAVIGGLTAVPFYATVGTVLRQLFGHDPDDDVEEVAKLLGLEDKLDVLMYGLPSLGGVYVGGSMNLELPVVSNLKGNQSWWEQMLAGTWEGALGVAYSSAKKVGNVVKYVQTDQYGRAAEEALPTFAANPFKAYRLATKGNYTASGRPIGDGGKISTAEAVGQAAGFQPLSRAKSWREKSVQDDLKERKSDVQSKLVTRYVMAGRNKDWKAQAQVVKEWREWNKENPDFQIKPLPKLAKARNRAVK